MRHLAALLALATVASAKPASVAKARPEAAGYLDELEKRGLVDKTAVTPARLAEEVELADDDLVHGATAQATARLYAIVEGPRWQDFADSDDFQDAEYRLGLALQRGGSFDAARRYYLRALARGDKAPYYLAALRAFVDTCLEGHSLRACVAEADRAAAPDANQELSYLRGRAAFEGATQDNADEELGRVTPKSRFYTSALYLRGVMRVKKRDWRAANDAFCAIADVKEGDTLRFFIDGRYYGLKDLARIGLGRVAHEEARYDDAFYHYFLVPEDSNRLPEALFEAAWSSLARKEYDLGARLIQAYLEHFPRAARAAEAKLLSATLLVKTCKFTDAEKTLDTFIAQHEPLIAAVDRALADGAMRNELAVQLLEREVQKEEDQARMVRERANRPAGAPPPPPLPPPPEPTTVSGRIAELLELDPRFFRLIAILRGLRHGAVEAGDLEQKWAALESRLGSQKVQAVDRGLSARELLQASGDLGRDITRARQALARLPRDAEAQKKELRAGIDQLEQRRESLRSAVEKAIQVEPSNSAGAVGLGPMASADRQAAADLKLRAARLEAQLQKSAGNLLNRALGDLRGHLEDLIRRARLGKIDSVVGEKRRLEKQIEDLAAGRFPPELFGKLHLEGLIGDDEEYWPPEQEVWLDEYENYK